MTTDSSQGTLMIIDDEPENLNVLGEMLRQAGWAVRAFPRGEMALAAARDDPPALVLLDIRMPDLDGYEVFRRFKADERLSQIPILFISALTAPADITAGFACGGVDYIAKPFRESEVLARIQTHLALRAAYLKLDQEHAQLQILERHRDLLTHMLVHDLRSPLQVIGGHLEMIADSTVGQLPGQVQESLHAAIHGTQQLNQMVSMVVDLSRMETTGIPLHPRAVPVSQLLRSTQSQALGPASSRRIAQQLPAACPPLWCDLELTTRIGVNLLANALKHSPPGSDIVLGADVVPNGVRIWVRDQGPGIPAAYQQRIFDKFGVIDLPAGDHPPSTGLGLAFCKLAVEAQGGSLGVDSPSGQGSTFWFILPTAPPAAGGDSLI